QKLKPLLAFSIYINGDEVFSKECEHGAHSMTSVYGMKFLTLMWYMYALNYEISGTLSENPGDYGTGSFSGQSISNASSSADTFFVISGLLITYGALLEHKTNGKVNWLRYYSRRFWRITPLYYFALFFYMYVLKVMCKGPMEWQLERNLEYCYKYWWTNILYIQNLHPYSENLRFRCMPWSWFVCALMQFYIISPIVLALLNWKKIWGFVAIGFLFCVDFLYTGIVSYYFGLPPRRGMDYLNDNPDDSLLGLDYITTKPHSRIASYLVGMCVGYLIFNYNKSKKIKTWILVLGWLISIFLGIAVVYCKYGTYYEPYWSLELSTLYHTFSRFLFAVAVAWCLFVCCIGQGGVVNRFLSWAFFIPTSRLVYGAFLFVPILMIFVLVARETQLYVSNLNFLYLFVAHLFVVLTVSLGLAVTVERPFVKLEKVFFGGNVKN
ncbi:nose resistant to fluoxetine protein 6-like, partial [Saccoglossus kowalevskii]